MFTKVPETFAVCVFGKFVMSVLSRAIAALHCCGFWLCQHIAPGASSVSTLTSSSCLPWSYLVSHDLILSPILSPIIYLISHHVISHHLVFHYFLPSSCKLARSVETLESAPLLGCKTGLIIEREMFAVCACMHCSAIQRDVVEPRLIERRVVLCVFWIRWLFWGWGSVWGGVGVGWGGDNTKRGSCYATWSSLALDATLDDLHLHFDGWGCGGVGVGWGVFLNTKRVSSYATWPSLAIDATLDDIHLHFDGWGCGGIGVGRGVFLNTKRVSSYATWSSLALDATLDNLHLHFDGWGWGGVEVGWEDRLFASSESDS